MIKFALVVITFLLVTSLWGFYISVRPPKIISTITPKELGLAYEQVVFKTVDDVSLSGWFIPSKKTNAKTIVLLHGYPADKGDILPALAFLNDAYNLFLFDFRHLGQSKGRYSTAGAKEIADLRAAIEHLKTRGINEMGVWGFSMGGAVALMTAPQSPEIKAIVSESSYARLDLMARELYRLPFLDYPLAELTRFWARLFLGVDIKESSPMDAVKKLQIPVLVVHSINDETIPFGHALLLQDALKNNPQAEFWFSENLTHGQLGGAYQKRIMGFFSKNI
ncbi:MAG: alpha/beta fold hydrolase [Patescibacteria group bacterium]